MTKADPARSRLYQRLALLQSPAPRTVAFLDEKLRLPGDWRDPARIGLGAAAKRLAVHGDDDAAARATDTLVALADRREGDRAEEVLVLALGNSAHALALEPILARVEAPRAQLRHIVAEALRFLDTPAGRASLLLPARDENDAITRRALDSLQQHDMDNESWSTLRAAVESGAIREGAYASLINLCVKMRLQGGARGVLEAMLAKGVTDTHVRARVVDLPR